MLRSLTFLACLLLLVQMTWSAAYCPSYCPDDDSPVCGSDQKTYSNKCELEQAACRDNSLHQVHAGSCARKMCEGVCIGPRIVVCGSDGKLYPQPCSLEAAACANPHLNLTIADRSHCKATDLRK